MLALELANDRVSTLKWPILWTLSLLTLIVLMSIQMLEQIKLTYNEVLW